MKNYHLPTFIVFLFLCLFSNLADAQIHRKAHYSRADSLRGSLRPERTCFDVKYYDLNLKIIPKHHYVEGFNEIHFWVNEPTSKIQLDLYKNLKIEKITWNGLELKYQREKDAIFISFPNLLNINSLQKVKVYYSGKPQSKEGSIARHNIHWDTDKKGRDWIGVSCEHAGASMWWPNKDHLSDEPDSMRVHWQVPSQLNCVSNGILESKQTNADQTSTYNWLIKNPINNYNVTFYLGYYKEMKIPYQNVSGDHEISFFYLDYEEPNAANYIKYVPAIVEFFERIFGEYPYWNEKFGIVHSSYLGMEHQTCVAIGSELGNYDNWYYFHKIPWHSTLIHEIAHEWWGNSITVADMADVWLHEGFATYCEFLFIEVIFGTKVYETEMQNLKRFIRNLYKVVGNRGVNDNTFEEGDIYMKGAVTLHEFRQEINDNKLFFNILMSFQMKYKNKSVSTQDFINHINSITGKDFNEFFKKRIF